MHLDLGDGRSTHLGYCYNVLPGESTASLIDQIRRICGPVRQHLGVDRLGVGLWISRAAANELRSSASQRRRLASALAEAHLYCFTLNAFPYGDFHAPRVKDAVFRPTWASAERCDYTIDLAHILAELLPDDVANGSISTLPIGPVGADRGEALRQLHRAADAFDQILGQTGKRIELAIEPEPGACFERVADLAVFLGARDGLGVCFDSCHAAVVGEDPTEAFAALAAAGIRCAKVQISSALIAERPDQDREHIAALDEPRYLHQVRSARGAAMDLPDAMAAMDDTTAWRIHFHAPVHCDRLGRFATSQSAISDTLLAALRTTGPPPHLEVETYTWGVLPDTARADTDALLVDGITREMRWTIDQLATLGAGRP